MVVEERESDALRLFLGGAIRPISSELALTESSRAIQRRAAAGGADRLPARLAEVLQKLDLRALDRELLVFAGRLEPSTMRTLDAIHLATVLSVPHPHTAFVSYDHRQLDAARRAGLSTASPGSEAA